MVFGIDGILVLIVMESAGGGKDLCKIGSGEGFGKLGAYSGLQSTREMDSSLGSFPCG